MTVNGLETKLKSKEKLNFKFSNSVTALNYIIFCKTLLYQNIFEGEKKIDIGNEYFSIDIMFPVQVTTFEFMCGGWSFE